MKNPFKKNTAKVNEDTSFNEVQYMTNGNLYDNYQKLAVQKNIDLSTLPNFKNVNNEIQKTLKNLSNQYINEKSIPDYYLLQLHCNYFVNSIVYSCNNFKFNSLLRQVIRFAWLNGKAGIFFDETINKYYGIIINSIEYNLYGEIETIEYWPLSLNLGVSSYEELTDKKTFKIKGKDCKNCAIFKWGSAAISAWIMYFPFVRFQNMMLKMIAVQALAFNKKYIYDSFAKNPSLKEMELWYDPLNIFIINTIGDGLESKFRVNDKSGEDMMEFINFYKQAIGCYYSLFGRRANLDFKKERNTVEEVSMTSGAIENLERDWYAEFNIFAQELMEINKRVKLIENLSINEIRLNNWIREERLNSDIIEHDNRIKDMHQGEK